MRETDNYNFPVPERNDYANIDTIAQTFERIDVEIKRIDVKVDESEQEVDYVKHPAYVDATLSGSNLYTVNLNPMPTEYTKGLGIVFGVTTATALNVQLRVGTLPAKDVLKSNGQVLRGTTANAVYAVRYNPLAANGNGAFILLGESEVEVGQQIIKPSTTKQTILKGLHDGTGYVEGDSNLIASNIIAGKTIFGITGNVQPKQFRTFSIYGQDAAVKLEWDFPFTTIVINNSAQSYNVYLSELPSGQYFGGGNYMPGFPMSLSPTSIESYFYKNGGWYTVKVYG